VDEAGALEAVVQVINSGRHCEQNEAICQKIGLIKEFGWLFSKKLVYQFEFSVFS
jgi:hypothetical protein